MAQPEVRARISPDWAKDWVARYLAADNSHDLDRLLSLAADDVVYLNPRLPGGVAEGKAAVSAFLVSLWKAFPDLAFEAVGEPFVSIDGARLAYEWRGTGTFTGRLEASGVDPTGARIDVTGVDVIEFASGLISRIATVTDSQSLLRQIGAVPAPPESGH